MIWLEACFRFAFYTGLRGSELARLRWKHVDLEEDLLFIYEQKSRQEQTLPLVPEAREALSLAPAGRGEDYVFRSPRSSSMDRNARYTCDYLSRRFRKYRREAGIERKVSLHGLRHGCASLLARQGKSAHVIKKYLRHADLGTSLKYIHMTSRDLAREMEDAFSDADE